MGATSKQQNPHREGTRASVTFPPDLYAALERIASENRVSVAWVVRDAVGRYVEAQGPLLPGRGDSGTKDRSGPDRRIRRGVSLP